MWQTVAAYRASQHRRTKGLVRLSDKAVIHFATMEVTRSNIRHLARALLVLVLFNGMACSFGHGQMLHKMFAHKVPSQSAMNMNHSMVMDHSLHYLHKTSANQDVPSMPGMDSVFGDCFFASSMPLGLLLFAVLSWLLRRREARPALRWRALLTHPAALLLSLQPRAP